MVILEDLAKKGYKPKVKIERLRLPEDEANRLLKAVIEDKFKRDLLGLLLEGLTVEDPREILIYGMFVKKKVVPLVPALREERIEKTIKWLDEAVKHFVKSGAWKKVNL